MLQKLGRRSPQEPTLEERFLDCHARIRHFCQLGRRLARVEAVPAEEAQAAAIQLGRYFGVALPLHVADEEESLMPRLLQMGDATALEALETMRHEHADAEEQLMELLEAWRAIAEDPAPQRCRATAQAVESLCSHFEQHLAAEEELIFPLLSRLPEREAQAIVDEMKARRE